MYTIGQVSEMFGLPISTLRYYDREGLFPSMERVNGIRRFGEAELEALRVIECLKTSGLGIRDIKQFMRWCAEGPATYGLRRELFAHRREVVLQEMERLRAALAMLDYKCQYYEIAEQEGSEEGIRAQLPDGLPPKMQAAYDASHKAAAPQDEGSPLA